MSKIKNYFGAATCCFLIMSAMVFQSSKSVSIMLVFTAAMNIPIVRSLIYSKVFKSHEGPLAPIAKAIYAIAAYLVFMSPFIAAGWLSLAQERANESPSVKQARQNIKTTDRNKAPAAAKPSASPKATAKPKPKATDKPKPKQPAKQKPKAPARPAAKYSDGSTTAKILAFNIAASHVKGQLKSPSTARFPGSVEKRDSVEHMGGNRYRVNSYVDSQNSFGAMTRTRFVVVVSLFDDGSKIEAFAAE